MSCKLLIRQKTPKIMDDWISMLFVSIGFLWPMLISGLYLIVNWRQIEAKVRYFLLSTIGGYALLVVLDQLIGYINKSLFLSDGSEWMSVSVLATTVALFAPTIVFSHILYRLMASNTKTKYSK